MDWESSDWREHQEHRVAGAGTSAEASRLAAELGDKWPEVARVAKARAAALRRREDEQFRRETVAKTSDPAALEQLAQEYAKEWPEIALLATSKRQERLKIARDEREAELTKTITQSTSRSEVEALAKELAKEWPKLAKLARARVEALDRDAKLGEEARIRSQIEGESASEKLTQIAESVRAAFPRQAEFATARAAERKADEAAEARRRAIEESDRALANFWSGFKKFFEGLGLALITSPGAFVVGALIELFFGKPGSWVLMMGTVALWTVVCVWANMSSSGGSASS